MSVGWTKAQFKALRDNYLLEDVQILPLVNSCGPERTCGAISSQRRKLQLLKGSVRGRNDYAEQARRGWPVMYGDPESRDREFVRMVLREGLRLGSMRRVS